MTEPRITPLPADTFAPLKVESADDLNAVLANMNYEQGVTPVIIGFDREGQRFLAYGWAPGGDGWDCGVVTDDTHSSDFDYNDTDRCGDCGAHGRRSLDVLYYPVAVL